MYFTVITRDHGVLRLRARNEYAMRRALRESKIVWLGYHIDDPSRAWDDPAGWTDNSQYPAKERPMPTGSPIKAKRGDRNPGRHSPRGLYAVSSVLGGGSPTLGKR